MKLPAKRVLFLLHRWVGIVLGIFCVVWFCSGMVMMYVGYPKLTEAERLQHLPALDSTIPMLAPAAALQRAGVFGPLRELRLAQASGARPVYLAQPASVYTTVQTVVPAVIVIDAQNGMRLPPVDAAHAVASARTYAGRQIGLQYLDQIQEDAFTHTRGLDRHRPLHRVALDDVDKTLLYISGQTGEVVRDAARSERCWNYVGAWIHWLYPLRGNVFQPAWSFLLDSLAIACSLAGISGAWIGTLRWRRRQRYRNGSTSPYQNRAMRWHHLGGLCVALIIVTWSFSGLMSMNPWHIFNSGRAPLQQQALRGDGVTLTESDAAPAQLLRIAGAKIRELRWQRVVGRTIVLAQAETGAPIILDSSSAYPTELNQGELLEAARSLLASPVRAITFQTKYDFYYYNRDAHSLYGDRIKPLPIVRLEYDDAYSSWVYLDPHTGQVISELDHRQRASRWLFSMLHSWDWLPLLENRPAWDILLITLSLGGLLTGATGCIIGARRLSLKLRKG